MKYLKIILQDIGDTLMMIGGFFLIMAALSWLLTLGGIFLVVGAFVEDYPLLGKILSVIFCLGGWGVCIHSYIRRIKKRAEE